MVSQLLLVLSSPQLIVNALKLDKIFMFTLFTHIPLIEKREEWGGVANRGGEGRGWRTVVWGHNQGLSFFVRLFYDNFILRLHVNM